MEAAALRCGDGQINYRQSIAAWRQLFLCIDERSLAGARKRRSVREISVVQ
jgi:hypothetical protein